MYCICCKKNNVRPASENWKVYNDNIPEEDTLWKSEKRNDINLTVNNEMVDNGIIQILNAGW